MFNHKLLAGFQSNLCMSEFFLSPFVQYNSYIIIRKIGTYHEMYIV